MGTDPSTTLILVDGSSYLYRAYYALPSLTGPQKQPTGALYGVINMIRKLLDEWQPERIAVVFDAPGRTFRDDWYDQYKANRPPMPDDLVQQIAPIHEMIRALGIPVLTVSGVEADDVIGTLAHRATQCGLKSIISTSDKDMAQLVNDSVELINTMTGERLDPEGVKSKYGVPPERMIDWLTLVGDTSDNIPGVDKVGPKTATKWIEKWGSLDEIVANSEKIGGKVGENLRSALDQIPLSRRLVTIRVDLGKEEGVDVEPDALRRDQPDYVLLESLSRQNGFRTWLKEYGEAAAQLSPSTTSLSQEEEADFSPTVTRIEEWESFNAYLDQLSKAPYFALSAETTALKSGRASLTGLAFALGEQEGVYLPLGGEDSEESASLPQEEVLEKLRPLLENSAIGKLSHDVKTLQHLLHDLGVTLAGVRYDTMLESYVLKSTAAAHTLDALALMQFQHAMIPHEEKSGAKNQRQLDSLSIERRAAAAVEEVCLIWKLHHTLYPELEKVTALQEVYEKIEVPLATVLGRIEQRGVKVDSEMLNAQGEAIDARLRALEERAYEEAGEEFNLQSPQQLQVILFEKMKLRVIKKTPKGAPSTSESVLQELALDYLLPEIVLEHRTLSKLKSTYLDKLPQQVNAHTGRIHTSYHQAKTITGRLSSSDPNLQNIPIRTSEGRMIRQAFIAEPDHQLVALDYSQIELRIMADLSSDERLTEAFYNDLDIHRVTASEVFGSPLDQVHSEQRRAAKAINFGLIYGMSAFGLARQLSIPQTAAQEYIKLYFQRYPGVKRYMDEIVQKARDEGYVETHFGRRLYLPDIKARNVHLRRHAERTAINAPMQGTAADIIKRAMIEIDAFLQEHSEWGVRMIMQVHDELVFEVPDQRVDQLILVARAKMEGAAKLSVPLKVDAGVGLNWDAAS